MFTREFDRRIYLALGVLACSLAFGGTFGMYILWPANREAGYAPPQPIAFNHALHAGTLKIDCQFCHTGAAEGAHAGVPPVDTCLLCHREVKPVGPDGAWKPEFAKLMDHWERQEPIRWIKVNDIADFAYFDHSRHIASGLDCTECHGPVEKMETMRREHGLKMSWCLSCHMQEPTEDQTGSYRSWSTRGPIHCTACHR